MRTVGGNNQRGYWKAIIATRPIPAGGRLFTVTGTVVKLRYDDNYRVGPRWLAVGYQAWIKPASGNLWRFINHSCNPNAGLRGRTVVALRRIKKGEEVTIDYSITEDDPYWRLHCHCTSKNCRGTIRSIRFLPAKTFRKYLPCIPIFLRQSYARARSGRARGTDDQTRIRRVSQP